MSRIEERLVRDIAAVTADVVVTGSDLQLAHDAVDQRLGRRHRHQARRRAALAAAAAVALAAVGSAVFVTPTEDDEPAQLAGPADNRSDPDADHLTGSLPTGQLIVGVWRLDNGRTMVEFERDGGVRFDDHGTLFSQPTTTGAYVIDGDRIIVTTSADDDVACIGIVTTMRASLPEPGALRFVLPDTSDACSPLPSGRGVLEQVLPTTSRSLRALKMSVEREWKLLPDKALLHGVWLAEGGGHLLELDPDGSYYVVDDSGDPIDSGQWSVRNTDLTLTSSDRSSRCGQGQQLILSPVEWVDPGLGTTGIRAPVKQNACGGPWTPTAWILIPHGAR